MLEQPSRDPYLVMLLFDARGKDAYGLHRDEPYFLTTGGGTSTDLVRARRFSIEAQAVAKARDMAGFVMVSGARAVRLSAVSGRRSKVS